MTRHEQAGLSETQRELRAVDAALKGATVAPEHESLGQLTRTLQTLQALPREEFLRTLDARAAQGFPRRAAWRAPSPRQRGVASPRGRAVGAGWRGVLFSRPGLALGGLVAVLSAVAVSLSISTANNGPVAARPEAGASQASPAVSAPALSSNTAERAQGSKAANTPSQEAASSSGPARIVERTATLEVGVAADSIQSTAQRVFTLVNAFGGYVRQSSVSSGGGTGQSEATFDVRVPSSNLAGAIAALSHLGRIRSETNTTNDVTDQYESLERSLGYERAQRQSLLAQLASASQESKAAALRSRMRGVEARISQLQGALRTLSSRIDYTSLALSLTGERAVAGASSGELTPGGAARDAARILDAALAILVLAAAALLPLAAILAVGWLLVIHLRRRLREQALDAS